MTKITLSASDISHLIDRFAPSIKVSIQGEKLSLSDAAGSWVVNLQVPPIENRIDAVVAGIKIQVPSIRMTESGVEVESRLS
jgi:hypothetical protein